MSAPLARPSCTRFSEQVIEHGPSLTSLGIFRDQQAQDGYEESNYDEEDGDIELLEVGNADGDLDMEGEATRQYVTLTAHAPLQTSTTWRSTPTSSRRASRRSRRSAG